MVLHASPRRALRSTRDSLQTATRAQSCNTIRRLEESACVQVLGNGFPAELTDDEPEDEGYEVVVMGRG